MMCSPEAETKGGGRISRMKMADNLLFGSCHGVLQGLVQAARVSGGMQQGRGAGGSTAWLL
jgi:hypothetical protein